MNQNKEVTQAFEWGTAYPCGCQGYAHIEISKHGLHHRLCLAITRDGRGAWSESWLTDKDMKLTPSIALKIAHDMACPNDGQALNLVAKTKTAVRKAKKNVNKK